jgi:hypothetical protein
MDAAGACRGVPIDLEPEQPEWDAKRLAALAAAAIGIPADPATSGRVPLEPVRGCVLS